MATSQGTNRDGSAWYWIILLAILISIFTIAVRIDFLTDRVREIEGEPVSTDDQVAISSVRPADGLPKWTPRLGGYVHGVWHMPDPKVMAEEIREHFRTKLRGFGEEDD